MGDALNFQHGAPLPPRQRSSHRDILPMEKLHPSSSLKAHIRWKSLQLRQELTYCHSHSPILDSHTSSKPQSSFNRCSQWTNQTNQLLVDSSLVWSLTSIFIAMSLDWFLISLMVLSLDWVLTAHFSRSDAGMLSFRITHGLTLCHQDTLDSLFNLSEPQFLLLHSGDNNSIYLARLLRDSNEVCKDWGNCLRVKDTEQTWQLNAVWNSELDWFTLKGIIGITDETGIWSEDQVMVMINLNFLILRILVALWENVLLYRKFNTKRIWRWWGFWSATYPQIV